MPGHLINDLKTPPQSVLGLSALAHDPAACLYVNGHLVAAVEEERLSRVKNTTEFPFKAIEFVLKQGGLDIGDIDQIAYYWDDRGELWSALKSTSRLLPENPKGILQFMKSRFTAHNLGPLLLSKHLAYMVKGHIESLPPIAFVKHHDAHLAAAWLSAPFEPDAGLIIDGRGEYAATSIYQANSRSQRSAVCIERIPFPNSLGVFYGAITQLLGYKAVSDEYRIMGLASYGGPNTYWSERINKFLQIHEDGFYKLNLSFLNVPNCSNNVLPWLNDTGNSNFSGKFRNSDGSFNESARDLAYAAQSRLESAVKGLIRRVVNQTKAKRLVVSGGVAMNGCAIGAARRAGIVEELHVPLAPYDAGSSVGATLAWLQNRGQPFDQGTQLQNPFTGPGYTDDEVEAMLRRYHWPFRRLGDVVKDAAQAISRGKIIGWFDGRMELGARALGARSILGDPRDAKTKDRINTAVKQRENYRPFAPSVLEEEAAKYFEVTRSRFMGEVVKALPETQKLVPAVVHVDGSARPQTVPHNWPIQSFRRLIEEFHNLTGIPMVVNTSFNACGEPIVCSPDDAIRCFAASGLERLYIGSFRVDKP